MVNILKSQLPRINLAFSLGDWMQSFHVWRYSTNSPNLPPCRTVITCAKSDDGIFQQCQPSGVYTFGVENGLGMFFCVLNIAGRIAWYSCQSSRGECTPWQSQTVTKGVCSGVFKLFQTGPPNILPDWQTVTSLKNRALYSAISADTEHLHPVPPITSIICVNEVRFFLSHLIWGSPTLVAYRELRPKVYI